MPDSAKLGSEPPDLSVGNVQQEMQRFWGDVYRTAHSDSDSILDPQTLNEGLDALEEMLLYRGHLISKEMPRVCRFLLTVSISSIPMVLFTIRQIPQAQSMKSIGF